MSQPEQPNPDDGELLVSDAEREAAATVVRHALTDGSLTIEEAEGRLGAAYTARRRRDLQQLLVDLPGGRLSLNPGAMAAARADRASRLVMLGLIGLVACAAIVASILSGHGPWPLVPIAFLAVRAFLWRGGLARRLRSGASTVVDTRNRRLTRAPS